MTRVMFGNLMIFSFENLIISLKLDKSSSKTKISVFSFKIKK